MQEIPASKNKAFTAKGQMRATFHKLPKCPMSTPYLNNWATLISRQRVITGEHLALFKMVTQLL
tara:strand:+ start:1382 stop:1573 length:192 start_codon:yes stop_codon:yes gene_type:complete